MASARLFAAAACALIGFHFYLMLATVKSASDTVVAREKMRRLSALVMQNFSGRGHLTDELFWKEIGRPADPMVDPWGSGFQLSRRENGEKPEFFWRSAGPDRQMGTRDDLESKVPLSEGAGLNLESSAESADFSTIDAK